VWRKSFVRQGGVEKRTITIEKNGRRWHMVTIQNKERKKTKVMEVRKGVMST
jgi:hypothetical protein